MLNPQPHRDIPPVFGKPWYWQRSSAVMESTRSLAHVVMEMREEIKKLENENRELRGDFSQRSHWAKVAHASLASTAVVEENPCLNLRRNASAPVLEGPYKENSVMTVRRYSMGSALPSVSMREGRVDRMRRTDSGWERLQEEIHGGSIFGSPTRLEVGKTNNRHSLQDYVHKNRAKVKTVSFLLPVDDIYTNRPVLPKHQGECSKNESESITQTDS
ncbi:uncharacterized protein LOC129412666 [Boleophthalmus pectinirostris]|uniref:uncharacterized protein LOC129412666 n=1 Tax=Boleophthalmus pectinirostris TaxID=150288 RepID=UPI002431C1A4|nr:uncharacterized protein LOC129412666 [Boleophthalmus pectinirostris]